MTDAELRELVDKRFDWQSVPGRMFWKIKPSKYSNIKIGSEAGSRHPREYWSIKINSKSYLRSRLVFLMFNEFLPKEIDHKDGNTSNDHPDNLRASQHWQNMVNRPKWRARVGTRGVYWRKKTKRRNERWLVVATANKKRVWLGSFKTPEEAEAAYKNFAEKNHGEFYRSE